MTQNTDPDFSGGVLLTLKSQHKPPPTIKRNMGLRSMNEKKKLLKFGNSKIVKDKEIKEKKMIEDARGRGASMKILRG
jgi:hypothetical protein